MELNGIPEQSGRRRARWSGPLAAVLLAAMCASLTGCVSGWRFPAWPARRMPCVLPPNATKSELVAHLNENIAKVRSWRSTDASIRPQSPPVTLSAKIAVEGPRNFRLKAQAVGNEQVDLGSNAEQFWLWMRQDGPNYVYTAQHDELHLVQQRLPIPFQPNWLMEALGVIPIDESQYTLRRQETEAGTANLVSDRLSPSGQPVRQVVLVDTCHGHIKQHALYDAQGRLIARAVLDDYKMVATSPSAESSEPQNVTLPHQIKLDWPEAKLSLTIRLKTVEVNPTCIAEQTWQLPQIPNCPPFDMGARLGRNLLDGEHGGEMVPFRQSPRVVDRGRQPAYPDHYIQNMGGSAEEPPWEDETRVPQTQRPKRTPFSWLRRLFQRR